MSGSEIRTPKSEMGKRSRRMVVWMIAVPIVILLLALAGANWRIFHLAYARHLIASDDAGDRVKGFDMVLDTHLRKGLTREEVRRLLASTEVAEVKEYLPGRLLPTLRYYSMNVEGRYILLLGFDEDDRLRSIDFIGVIPLPN